LTYAVSLARTRRFTTPLGTVSIHHVDPGSGQVEALSGAPGT
jgi:hypothetical protein